MSFYKQLSTPPPPLPKSVPAATNWIRQLAEKKTLFQVIVLVYQDTNIIMCE